MNAMTAKLLAATAFSFLLVMSPIGAQQDRNDDLKTHTATGCLMKVGASDAYTLTDENGKTWGLRSSSVKLEPHVGHTITVTGTIPTGEPSGNDTSPQNHLVVTKVEKVREDCNQP
jgi:hypothetical protein